MKPDELERLLWEQTEGTISADDRGRLEAYVAANPAAERQHRDVKAFAELLGSVGDVETPPDLPARIEAALATRPRPRPRFSWSAVVSEMLAPQWRVRIAWAVVGLVVGMTATALMVADFGHPSRDDLSRYYGSMTQPEIIGTAPLSVDLPDSLGSLALRTANGVLLVDLDVTRPVAGGVTVELVGGGLTVESFQGTGAATSRVEASREAVLATLSGAGHVSARIGLPARAENLLVRISEAGRRIDERQVDVRSVSP